MIATNRFAATIGALVMSGFCNGCVSWKDGEPPDSSPPGSSEPAGPEYVLPPSRCMPEASIWAQVRLLHDDNELSTHELIKCGGLQTSMSRTFLIVLIASNESLFDSDAYAKLVEFAGGFNIDLEVPFDQEPDGRWSTLLNSWSDSKFYVSFRDPASDAVITQDPFVIDSYLTGVTADPTLTIDEMKANLGVRNHISFSWQGAGPLAHILAYGEPVPNPFAIQVSFADLAEMVWGFDLSSGSPNYGPLEAIRDLRAESEIVLRDQRGATTIDYNISGTLSPLRSIARSGVEFDVRHIHAQNGAYHMEGTATDLRYEPSSGNLAGRLQYRVTGPGVNLRVTDTYLRGGTNVVWSCVE
jgi:hypothetical protein